MMMAQACIEGECMVNGSISGLNSKTGNYSLDIRPNKGVTGSVSVDINGRRVVSPEGFSYEQRLDNLNLGNVEVPLQNPVEVPPPTIPYGPSFNRGEGNYIDLNHTGRNNEPATFRVPKWHYQSR